MRILFIGDIVGKPGRQAVAHLLTGMREEYTPDFVVANGENAAGGMGITRETGHEIFQAGVDAITLGNHVWAKKEAYPFLDEEPRVIRPANYPEGVPGHGYVVLNTRAGEDVALLNLCGRVFMDSHPDSPFKVADAIVETLARDAGVIIVDFHAEATSEKNALAYYLDGRVSAVIGTHTHVQTADERILPGGTAYITDVGMTGPLDSVLGLKKELSIARFITQMPCKFEVAEGDTVLSAVIVDIDSATGKASRIERVQKCLHEANHAHNGV